MIDLIVNNFVYDSNSWLALRGRERYVIYRWIHVIDLLYLNYILNEWETNQMARRSVVVMTKGDDNKNNASDEDFRFVTSYDKPTWSPLSLSSA